MKLGAITTPVVTKAPLSCGVPISVAARSKTWVCGRALAGIVGSNPTGGMGVCLVQCFVR
jgi:hypothetical protein